MILKTATSAWQKISLVLLGLILSLVLLEVGMRLGGFVLLSIQEYGNLQSIKQKGAYRILCLGESTTEGAYPHLLEQVLNRRNIGVRFSVIDKGSAGMNTNFIVSQIGSNLAEYHPDMVVAMMGVNDGGKHMPFEKATISKGTLFIRSFRVYKLIRFLDLHLLTKAEEMGFYKPPNARSSSWKAQTPSQGTEFKEASARSVPLRRSFKRTVELDPNINNAYVRSGCLFLEQGNLSQAENSFKKAVELNPKNYFAYQKLGWVYKEQRNLSRAEDCFRKVIELDPKNDDAYAGFGLLYRMQSKFSQAEDVLKKAIELNPESYDAYSVLGWVYIDQNKLPQADDCFKKAMELHPYDSYLYGRLGWLCVDQSRFSQAEAYFKKAIELNPQEHFLYSAISIFYERTGKPELAEEYTRKSKGLKFWDLNSLTVSNYRKLKEILDGKGIKLVCVQYPVRNVAPLKRIFEKDKGVIFVDNERVFKEALRKGSYKEYFRDMFAGDFGHCTVKGNTLLAQNIADVILREVFNK
jgi:tetratricopeptide (TPR) repeat protein